MCKKKMEFRVLLIYEWAGEKIGKRGRKAAGSRRGGRKRTLKKRVKIPKKRPHLLTMKQIFCIIRTEVLFREII